MKFTSCFLILFLKILSVKCTHIVGSWNTDDLFLFLMKFGFQKTDSHNPYSSGYVYGNITTDNFKLNKSATFVVIDYDNFIGYYRTYRNRDSKALMNKDKACQQMFSKFDFGKCGEDYLKKVNFISEIPCDKNGLCKNAGDPADYVRGSQFSYQIKDYQQPK